MQIGREVGAEKHLPVIPKAEGPPPIITLLFHSRGRWRPGWRVPNQNPQSRDQTSTPSSTTSLMPPKKKQKLNIPVGDGLNETQVMAFRDALVASKNESEVLQYLMSYCGVQPTKLAPGTLPSFSSVTWEQVCIDFGLSSNHGPEQLDSFDVPDLFLPPSVHKRVLMTAVRTLDVYRDVIHHTNEASRVRLFEAVSEALIYCQCC